MRAQVRNPSPHTFVSLYTNKYRQFEIPDSENGSNLDEVLQVNSSAKTLGYKALLRIKIALNIINTKK